MESAPHFRHSYKLVTPVSRTKFSPPTHLLILHFLSAWTTYCISSYCNNNNNYSNNCVYKLKPLVPSAITLTETEALAHVFNNVVNNRVPSSSSSSSFREARRQHPQQHLFLLFNLCQLRAAISSERLDRFRRNFARNCPWIRSTGCVNFSPIGHRVLRTR